MMAAKVVMEVAVEMMLRVEFSELWERCPNTVQFLFNSSVVCVHPWMKTVIIVIELLGDQQMETEVGEWKGWIRVLPNGGVDFVAKALVGGGYQGKLCKKGINKLCKML